MKTKKMVYCAIIAALYTALTVMLSPLSFGVVQIRFSEALTLLAIFSPWMACSVTLGCFMSNLIGMFMGATVIWDVIFGTLATGVAAYMSYMLRDVRIKNIPFLSATMPVLLNGLIVGTMITVLYYDVNYVTLCLNMISVAVGELVACFALGLPLIKVMEKNNIDKMLIGIKAN